MGSLALPRTAGLLVVVLKMQPINAKQLRAAVEYYLFVNLRSYVYE